MGVNGRNCKEKVRVSNSVVWDKFSGVNMRRSLVLRCGYS